MKVYLDWVGCRLNQSEIEQMAAQLRALGHQLVEFPSQADLVIVNTCAVTASAASDSRQKARQALHAGAKQLVLTGCWATLEPEAAKALSPESRVFANDEKDGLVQDILDIPVEQFDLEPLQRQPLPGSHQRTRAFIKIQEGCDNHCTFCITRLARGASRSVPISRILSDIQFAIRGGVKEVVLSGVQLGSWGKDFAPSSFLQNLLQLILSETDVPRIRLSSIEPWDVNKDLLDLWKNSRMCRHLHLPLQSGCDATLRRMGRINTKASFASTLEMVRQAIPEVSITTDIIVGFPGETDADFQESLEFASSMNFAQAHVFQFSLRPGTPAAKMDEQIPAHVKKKRSALLRHALEQSAYSYRTQFMNQYTQVLWESAEFSQGVFRLSGLTDNFLRVRAESAVDLWNQISLVMLERLDGLEISAVMVNPDSRITDNT